MRWSCIRGLFDTEHIALHGADCTHVLCVCSYGGIVMLELLASVVNAPVTATAALCTTTAADNIMLHLQQGTAVQNAMCTDRLPFQAFKWTEV